MCRGGLLDILGKEEDYIVVHGRSKGRHAELRAQLQTTQICLDKKQQPGVLSLTYWVANKPADRFVA